MATLTESLEKRIQQLKELIASQQQQLAAYEGVLALERGTTTPGASVEVSSSVELPHPASGASNGPAFTGNKTEFIAALVAAHGSTGATPKDIDQAFAQHGIERGRNLIYSALSGLVKQRKLQKQGERYVAVTPASRSPRKKKRAAKATPSRPAVKKASSPVAKPAPGARAQRTGGKKAAKKKAPPQAGTS